jgi:sugar/nucleoside kinase (ribokinase family)
MSHNSPPARVLCTGILVADIFVPPLSALPAAGELRATEDFLLDTGGCAANVATCLTRLGVPTAVAGRVGNDVFGGFIASDLHRKGIDTFGVHHSNRLGTSKTVILPVIGEDRRFIHTFGANAEFSEADIDLDTLPVNGILYLGGFLIMPALKPRAVATLFRTARERGITTVLDVVVSADDASASMRQLIEILPFTDYFLPNDEEARTLTGEAAPYRQAERILEAGCGTVLITQGKKGTLLLSETMHYEADAYPIDFVDGSGSGDAFTAGWITGLVEKWDVHYALEFASAVGASACTKLGCTTGVYTRAESDAFVRQHRLSVRRHPIASDGTTKHPPD